MLYDTGLLLGLVLLNCGRGDNIGAIRDEIRVGKVALVYVFRLLVFAFAVAFYLVEVALILVGWDWWGCSIEGGEIDSLEVWMIFNHLIVYGVVSIVRAQSHLRIYLEQLVNNIYSLSF